MLLYPHQGKEQEGPSLSFSVIPIPCSHWNFIMFPEAKNRSGWKKTGTRVP